MDKIELLRKLPSVSALLLDPEMVSLAGEYPHATAVESIRKVLDNLRENYKSGEIERELSIAEIVLQVSDDLHRTYSSSLKPAINATGIVLHTGLGRAVLPKAAVAAVTAVASGHSTLEIDAGSGLRGSRVSHVDGILTRLTGADAATAVNNNAAALFLGINALAYGKEVIISRGQLVEIGGSFRIPDIIRRAGCILVEVGTTNRTRISDYEEAVTENTALILRVHPSNFRIVGFSEEPSLHELVRLGETLGIPVMDDLGSGALVDLSLAGLFDEPMVSESVKAGCDLVTFSGDKLLGGPQAGLIVGKKESVEKCKVSPIARVVRLDKMTLAALEATLKLYLDPDTLFSAIPVLHTINRTSDDIRTQARRLAARIRRKAGMGLEVGVIETTSQVGGGSLPGQNLPSWAITLKSSTKSTDDLSRQFRLNVPPIFGRIENDLLLLDVRTVFQSEVGDIVKCVGRLFQH